METKLLLFNRWDLAEVKVDDPGLKKYVNVRPVIVPRTAGRMGHTQIHRNRMNIVERFINKLMVPGHRGRKHKISSGNKPGSTQRLYKTVDKAFEIIQKRKNQNPVQILVKAVENSAILEEIAAYRLGGIIARQSVVTSPQRRLDLALRYLTQGIFKSSFKSKRHLANVIADELIAASEGDAKSFAIGERNRIEREAEGSR